MADYKANLFAKPSNHELLEILAKKENMNKDDLILYTHLIQYIDTSIHRLRDEMNNKIGGVYKLIIGAILVPIAIAIIQHFVK